MKSNISIDVSLLAIVLAMYFTNQDDRMTLILMVALITHVLLTSGGDNEDLRHPYLGAGCPTISRPCKNHGVLGCVRKKYIHTSNEFHLLYFPFHFSGGKWKTRRFQRVLL